VKPPKARADLLLVERGLAATRAKAQALIMAGSVSSNGRRVEKAGELLPPDASLDVVKPLPYVGRGGLKLEQALDAFGVSPAGLICLDVGSSTGGFSDCLLQRGAARVYAVDVDVRQLDDRLRRDPRLVPVEKNARFLVPSDLPETPALAVMDVSFISVLKVLPALAAVLAPAAAPVLLSLIKPQFEAGRDEVGRKGIVRDAAVHAEVLKRIAGRASALGFRLRSLVRCSTRGQKGNQEFFAKFDLGGVEPTPEDVLKWVGKVTSDETD
jgi:23S rRNA (cytidine1920-2'-O)/16S rRNA (cytidine1409-2'-O)-methyltransferase